MTLTKTCPQCKESKGKTLFYKNSSASDGCSSYCKVCQNLRTSEYARRNRAKIAEKDYLLKQRYGITRNEYNQMMEAQGGKCAICGFVGCPTGRRLAVDHNHQTGEVRGLLCSNCNTGIGKLGDSIEYLNNAIKYLNKYG